MINYSSLAYSDPRVEKLNKTEKLKYVKYVIKYEKVLKKMAVLEEYKKYLLTISIDKFFDSI
ncbi:MAG: hypothetical protein KBF12_00090 [Sebaldella sp.]|nr:hypothetical protein [Sebaldella sp.]